MTELTAVLVSYDEDAEHDMDYYTYLARVAVDLHGDSTGKVNLDGLKRFVSDDKPDTPGPEPDEEGPIVGSG